MNMKQNKPYELIPEKEKEIFKCIYSLDNVEMMFLKISVIRVNKVYLRENNNIKMRPYDSLSFHECLYIDSKHPVYSTSYAGAINKAKDRVSKNDSLSPADKKKILKKIDSLSSYDL